ncbi:MAG: T9SS type A sorting domain-containing protein [Bacteroidetes bacterium]|nr:T9SS type A sorting domain-containing protein [Bacteroidota bacterium]
MKTKISLLVLILFATILLGQPNLIPNPSFEQYYSCPNNNQQVDTCIGWHSLMFTPDYYNKCSNVFASSIPDNISGYQDTYDGDGYMGLISYFEYTFWREIIGAKLLDTLIIGNEYNFSMRISRGNWVYGANNITASNKIGVRLSTNEIISFDTIDINNTSQLYTNTIITDSANWFLLSWNFIADSNYKYIAIGNFFDDANTDTINFSIDTIGFYWESGIAYYFIDSLNLKCISTICITGNLENLNNDDISNVVNNENLIISSNKSSIFYVDIFNAVGQHLMSKQASNTISIDLSSYKTGVYFVSIRSPYQTKQIKVKKF